MKVAHHSRFLLTEVRETLIYFLHVLVAHRTHIRVSHVYVVRHSRHNCPRNPEVTHAGESVGEQRVKEANILQPSASALYTVFFKSDPVRHGEHEYTGMQMHPTFAQYASASAIYTDRGAYKTAR